MFVRSAKRREGIRDVVETDATGDDRLGVDFAVGTGPADARLQDPVVRLRPGGDRAGITSESRAPDQAWITSTRTSAPGESQLAHDWFWPYCTGPYFQ